MPVYDFTSGLKLLDKGLDAYAKGVGAQDDGAYQKAVGDKLAAGDYDGAVKLAYARGDIETGLKLDAFTRKQNAPKSQSMVMSLTRGVIRIFRELGWVIRCAITCGTLWPRAV